MGKTSAIANVLIVFSPIIAALPILAFSPFHSGLSFVLTTLIMACGFIAFAIAKLTQFRSGRWFSFGYRCMPQWARYSYVGGLVAVAFGAVGSLSTVWLR
ncbi:MAG: hypothetical protein J0I77_02640 [Rudaea sp.]|uniref:hypothetical protein n=1 Tax=unclassified Rudaea TaxID=2627037 RepID=UPI0010F7D626|nr:MULTISPECIES: hypothetical protein [unclassified Rudaea]MBN8884596.1 hypothetical protein [Rudaea sp.]